MTFDNVKSMFIDSHAIDSGVSPRKHENAENTEPT